jgi:glutamate-1-semialdehyde 2,1-aminomutase
MKNKYLDIIIKKSKNQYLYDIKNEKYLDFCLGNGTLLLGHGNRIFKKSIKSQVDLGSIYSEKNIYQKKFEKVLSSNFKSFSKFIFCNSGSEANYRAIRIAKAISIKKKIGIISGGWHGSVDHLMFDYNKRKEQLSSGIGFFKKNTIVLPSNNIKSCKNLLKKNHKDLSLIMVEAIQSGHPNKDYIKLIKFLYQYCKTKKIIFHLDECITGLRVKNLTMYKKIKIKPDMITLGKCFGGGLPVGIIAFNNKVEKKLNRLNPKVFFGGTFSGNPFSTRIGYDNFIFIKKNHNAINKKINFLSSVLEKKVNDFCKVKDIKFQLLRYESIIKPFFKTNNIVHKFSAKNSSKREPQKMRNFLLKKNIFVSKNSCFFISQCHTLKNINYLSGIIIKYLKENYLYN